MALRIYNNISSLNAQRYLGITNSQMSKSLERLSSGLRINHAADDASGLAISEKLRGQISGLKRASMNAQDGISMLQTAEGGLQEIQSIVQRMRELAVQAANGTYTANDRAELQKEVDQLKSEINRISASTEFNTKKLLNGDASALWSASSNKLEAIIKGKVAEGEYSVSVTSSAGKNYIYKTDIMTIGETNSYGEVDSSSGASWKNAVKSIDNIEGFDSGSSVTLAKVDTDGTTSDDAAAVLGYTGGANVSLANNGTAYDVSASGYLEVEFLAATSANENDTSTSSSTQTRIANAARVRFYNAETGYVSDWVNVDLDYISGDGSNDTNPDTEFIELNSSSGLTTDGSTNLFSAGGLRIITTNDNIGVGDKAVISLSDYDKTDSATDITVKYTTSANHPEVTYANAISSTSESSTNVYVGNFDTSTGTFSLNSFRINFNPVSSITNGENLIFNVLGEGDVATSTTKLKDVQRFVNDDGRNIFDNTQSLTIFGNGKQTTIYLEGDDTLADFESKLEDALVNDLEMGDSSIKNDLVYYDTTAGTFKIQSGLIGEDSKISFIGDQKLIDGLSLTTVQKGENSSLTVSVTKNGATVGSDTVNDYTLRGVISGVELSFDKNLGVSVSGDSSGNLTFTASGTTTIELHLVDNSTALQIGANEGQDINVSVAQIDTKSLDLDNVLVVDQESAQKAITKIDRALEFISGARSTIGAQVNRLEHAITNLDTARENLTASESRIRDLDIAEEMANFTRYQILQQSSTAMLAQANQLPQLALQLLGR
ncbi:flagellin domain protein [Deferribacter desulfuricans SSM1]|uniref:Flagellin n=1 Tax=Deferribacter desulfuricans (strain DSM 14783 / JCM 11476 / NBRC 101012 / SSM1) TaxID=639282 RepID=D3P9T1_DEFDS|nr:flagellin [Deferribacter desulfuricans]BAI81471.1 flagellin domain protein [Deferribacter desulfuricans SSM1]